LATREPIADNLRSHLWLCHVKYLTDKYNWD